MTYSRRVSFNNLSNDFEDKEPHKACHRKKHNLNLILRNQLNNVQVDQNIENSKKTINYHVMDVSDDEDEEPVSRRGSAVSNGNNDEELEDMIERNKTQLKSRRKSYSEMTNEELMALDPQFNTPKTDLSNFKFDNAKTYYLSTKKNHNVLNGKTFLKSELKPSNNYKSYNLTIRTPGYENNFERTILCVFSGRKHTWNSIYWLLDSGFLQNNDYLVIASAIPETFIKQNHNHYKEILRQRCEKLLNWISDMLPEIEIKVTIELVIENSSKKFIQDLFVQYNPNILAFGNKSTNLNFKYPVKLNQSIGNNFLVKYSSYLIKYSTIPTIIVNSNSDVKRKNSMASLDSIDSDYMHTDYSSPKTYINLITQPSDKSLAESRNYLNQMKSKDDHSNGVTFNESVKFDSKLHSIYNSQLQKQNSSNSDKIYKVKSLIDDTSSTSTSQTSINDSDNTINLKNVKSNSSGMTTKMIKSNLKAPVKQEKKKGFWKKVFS